MYASSKSILHSVLLTAVFLGVAHRSADCNASYTLVTSSAGQLANDFVDWGSLGQASNTGVSAPFTLTSSGGIQATYNDQFSQALFIVQAGSGQGFPPYWGGNFTPGDNLIDGFPGSSAPVTVSFSTLIHGAGAQIQLNDPGAFTAQIAALDASNNILASFTELGNSNSAKDGSAIYLGILSDTASIAAIRYSMISTPPGSFNDFALNRLLLSVPEPSSLALAALACLGFAALAWRRLAPSAQS